MNNKIIKLALMALIALMGFNACNQDNERSFYDENPNVNPPAMTFVQSVMNLELTPDYEGVLKVEIARTDASTAETAALTFTATPATAALFTLSSTTITFAEGDYLAYAVINFDLNSLSTGGIRYDMQLAFAGEQEISKSGSGSITISASRKLTFVDVGVGSYVGAIGGPFDAGFERAVEVPTMYKIKDFFVNAIIVQIDPAAGTATIDFQPLGESIFQGIETESWIRCTAGTYANGIITFGGGTWANAYFTDNTMTRGMPMDNEVFRLPAGAY